MDSKLLCTEKTVPLMLTLSTMAATLGATGLFSGGVGVTVPYGISP